MYLRVLSSAWTGDRRPIYSPLCTATYYKRLAQYVNKYGIRFMEKSCCWNYLTAFSTPQHIIWDVKDSPGYRKDTCDIVEEILILEVSLLADFVDGFQEQVLTPRPLMLKQNNYVAQSHIISAVCESSELQGQKWHGEGQERYITLKKYIGLISLTPEQIQNKLFRSTFHSALTYTFKTDWKIPGKIPNSLQWLVREV